MDNKQFMKIAIEEAKKGDYPFGAVVVKNGKVVSYAHNTVSKLDPTAHAEINAIRNACKTLNTINLNGCILYTTCEPCLMCFMAAWWAQISKIVYGMEIEDIAEKEWKIDVKCNELNDRLKNKIQIKGGVLRDDCLKLFN